MYPISTEALNLLKKNYKQTALITFSGVSETITLTEADIVQGGLSVDRCSTSGERIEIGSAISSELQLILNNKSGKFDDIVFEGAELYVRIGVKKWDASKWENATMTYIPLGYFTVDEPPRKLTQIKLSALDRMVCFDAAVNIESLTFPMTVGELINRCCTVCAVPLGTVTTELLNNDYVISTCPEASDLTYRQLIMWAAEITGTCAYIDWQGKLRLEWYHRTDTVITPSERYSSDMYENDVIITGVEIVDIDDNVYRAGTDAYTFRIESNGLIQDNYQSIANSLNSVLGGFSYRPYEATIKPMPHLFPLDIITYTDKFGIQHTTVITNATYKINSNTGIKGTGQTSKNNGYARMNPLTKRESTILSQMKKSTIDLINTRQQAVLELNEIIGNSLGLRKTTVPAGDGTNIYYYHDASTLENSNIIYTFRAGGFAWTDDWNDGSPVWQYGLERDGNAVLNVLSTYKITTDYLDAGCVTAEKLSVTYRNSVTDAITGAETRVTQSFQAADGVLSSQISEKASQSDLDALGNTVSSNTTLIQQNSSSILLKASQSDLDTLSGRVTTAESSISLASDQIALVVNASGIKAASIVTAINDAGSTVKISADHINIDGIVTIGHLATTNDIPTTTGELLNNSGFQTSSDVVSIIDGRITAGFIEALSIEVGTAQISGKLTASRINADGLVANNVAISGAITATTGTLGTMTISGKLTFGNNSAYYIDANMNDARYYINLPGFKVDDVNGAVFSGKLSAATGTFSGAITATSGTIGNASYNWTIGSSGSSASMYCGTSSLPGIPIGITSNRVYFGTDGLSYSGDTSYSSTFGYTTVIKSGFVACSGDQSGSGLYYRTVKYGCSGIDFFHSGSTNPTSGTLGTMKGSLEVSSTGHFKLSYAEIWYADKLIPNGTGSVDIGSASYKWNNIYATNSIIQTSDENEKNSIQSIPDSYGIMFDNLNSIIYRLNAGTSNRYHCGLGAQGVISALEAANLTTSDFAGVCVSTYTDEATGEEHTSYGIRYGEFIALCIDQIQKLKARVAHLETQLVH